jgi:DNA-binding transcriptional ArsR family regulator
MVQYSQSSLDSVFAALSDPTRRAVLASLTQGSLPVTELATAHQMSLTGFIKHLRVLEDAGLITRSKHGRVVECTISAEPLRNVADWVEEYRRFWDESLNRLEDYLRGLQAQEAAQKNSPKPTKKAREKKHGHARKP